MVLASGSISRINCTNNESKLISKWYQRVCTYLTWTFCLKSTVTSVLEALYRQADPLIQVHPLNPVTRFLLEVPNKHHKGFYEIIGRISIYCKRIGDLLWLKWLFWTDNSKTVFTHRLPFCPFVSLFARWSNVTLVAICYSSIKLAAGKNNVI